MIILIDIGLTLVLLTLFLLALREREPSAIEYCRRTSEDWSKAEIEELERMMLK